MDNWKRDWPRKQKYRKKKRERERNLKAVLGAKSDLNISGFIEEIIDPGNM